MGPWQEIWVLLSKGWGRTTDASTAESAQLRSAQNTVISNAACAAVYGGGVIIIIICTSTAGARGPCRGNSGGPLTRSNGRELIGVVSFVDNAGCQRGQPAGYARVSR